MDESRIGQYSISVTTYPIMALVNQIGAFPKNAGNSLHQKC